MAFARHNIEKHRLIELVRLNPILWDCRLPHYKRSDKKKDVKWCELGRTFNVSGERVQRTFTSLREIFRRELNHEKLLGDRFTSKWEYYDAMSFLKDVIRERKTRDRFRKDLNGMSKEMLDEYAYYTPHPSRNCLNIQPDVIINDTPTPPRQQENSSSRSTTPSISIKEEEVTDGDDEGNENLSRTRSCRINPHTITNHSQSQRIASPEQIIASTSNNHQRQSAKNPSSSYCCKTIIDEEDNSTTIIRQTPREILYTKFGDFLSARLNTLNETVANDLMNRILLLIAEN